MKLIAPLIFLVTAGLVLGQQPAQNSTGGWRRASDPPAAAPSNVPPDAAAAPAQNPEPTARDQYGQPIGQPAPVQAGQPNAAPPDQSPDAITTPAPPPAPPEVVQEQQPMPQQSAPPAYGSLQQRPTPMPQQSPRPAYGLPPTLTVKPGTYITVRINQPLSSDRNHEGDTFTATLMQPVVVDGVVVAQRGQTVYGVVAEATKAKTDKPSRLQLGLTGLTAVDGTQVPFKSQLVVRTGGSTPPGVQAGTVVGTSAVGAVIGGAAAWGTGAAIGAGAGAAAGIIGVLVTRHHPTIVYPETALTFQVTSPATISTERVPQAFRYVGPQDFQQGMQYATRPGSGPGGPPAYYNGPGYGYQDGPGYGYPYAYGYGYPYSYGYPYWYGPSIGVYWGGWGWGGWGRGWGGYRRWR